MDREMLLSEILNVLNLDENMVGEHTVPDSSASS